MLKVVAGAPGRVVPPATSCAPVTKNRKSNIMYAVLPTSDTHFTSLASCGNSTASCNNKAITPIVFGGFVPPLCACNNIVHLAATQTSRELVGVSTGNMKAADLCPKSDTPAK